jgi:hypothetical protein
VDCAIFGRFRYCLSFESVVLVTLASEERRIFVYIRGVCRHSVVDSTDGNKNDNHFYIHFRVPYYWAFHLL